MRTAMRMITSNATLMRATDQTRLHNDAVFVVQSTANTEILRMRLKAIAIKCLDIAVLLSPPLLVAVKPTAMLATSESPLSLAAQVLLVAAVFAGPGLAGMVVNGDVRTGFEEMFGNGVAKSLAAAGNERTFFS